MRPLSDFDTGKSRLLIEELERDLAKEDHFFWRISTAMRRALNEVDALRIERDALARQLADAQSALAAAQAAMEQVTAEREGFKRKLADKISKTWPEAAEDLAKWKQRAEQAEAREVGLREMIEKVIRGYNRVEAQELQERADKQALAIDRDFLDSGHEWVRGLRERAEKSERDQAMSRVESIGDQLATTIAERDSLKAQLADMRAMNEANCDTLRTWQRLALKAAAREAELRAILEHAIELGYLGDGSTANWAKHALSQHAEPPLLAEVKRYREALEWYADPKNYVVRIEYDDQMRPLSSHNPISEGGERARQALAKQGSPAGLSTDRAKSSVRGDGDND